MLTKVDSSGTWSYEWDYENRLKKVTKPNNDFVEYKYDGLGRRVERAKSDGTWTKFTYDGMDVFLDQNSSGTNVKYINGLGIDNKLGQIVNGNTQYFLQDHLGSTTAITDSLGLVTEQNTYDAFGNPTNSTFSTRYQYTGREYDEFSGLYYYRARWYSSELGRFISEDPIGFAGGDVNLYGYVGNKSINRIDPLGLDDADIIFRNTDQYKELEELGIKVWDSQIPRLSECSKNWLKKYFPDLDLEEVKIHSGIPFFVLIDADGYTSKNNIFIKEGHYKPDTVEGLSLIGHELTHTRQYKKYGNLNFKVRYAWQSVTNFGYGKNMAFEKESYDNGSNIFTDLNKRRNNNETPCGCQQTLNP